MALNVAQYEELCELLREVPSLVDKMEARLVGFADDVLAWLKKAETVLGNNRLPIVSQVSTCRAILIQAARGLQAKDLVFAGRATPRKVVDATASMALERANQLLHGVVMERQAVFQEAELMARRMIAVAEAKGLVQSCGGSRGRQEFLKCVQQKISGDSDFASAYIHLVGLVGKNDILVFLDRALGTD